MATNPKADPRHLWALKLTYIAVSSWPQFLPHGPLCRNAQNMVAGFPHMDNLRGKKKPKKQKQTNNNTHTHKKIRKGREERRNK